MTITLSIASAHNAQAAAIAHIESMTQAQEFLLENGLLEAKDRANIPAVPNLYTTGIQMAQKAIAGLEHVVKDSSIALEYIQQTVFKEEGRAFESLPAPFGQALLGAVLLHCQTLLDITKQDFEFLKTPHIQNVRSGLDDYGSFTYSVWKDNGSGMIHALSDKGVMAQDFMALMTLSELTETVDVEEIKAALIKGDYKHELFTVKTQKAGIKFQLTKPALMAIRATLENISETKARIESAMKATRNDIRASYTQAAQECLTSAEHTAQIMENFRKRRNKAA